MPIDGGVEAITGFVFQSMAALLDSLVEDDWLELSIDPSQESESYQKVDIEWMLKDGRRRLAQVKHSINSIEVPEAKKWATELKQSRIADEYRLLLYAPTTGGVPKIESWNDVKIEVKQGDIMLLWDALAFRTLKYLRSRKQADPVHTQEAIRLLVGKTIIGVTERKTWKRADIEELLLQIIDSHERHRPLGGIGLNVSLLRVVRSATHGRCEEFVRYTFQNRTNESLIIPVWQIYWTDPDGIEITRVWEPSVGRPAYRELIHDGTGTFELEITPSAIIPPGGAGNIEVHLSQRNLIEQIGNPPAAWSFKDPLLATDFPHPADVFVIFPREGAIEASQPCNVCARTAHWEIMTGPEQRRLTAVMQASSPRVAANENLLANLAQHFELDP